MIKKLSIGILIALFISSVISELHPDQESNETCSWTNKCPITDPGSYPVCGRTPAVQQQPGVYSAMICGGESPYIGGGEFNLENTYLENIIKIKVMENRQNYCSTPKGVGTDTFSVHCACSGGCLIRSTYKVFYGKPSESIVEDQ